MTTQMLEEVFVETYKSPQDYMDRFSLKNVDKQLFAKGPDGKGALKFATPSLGEVHSSAFLSNVGIDWLNTPDAQRFQLSRAIPTVPVKKETDRFNKWEKEDMERLQAQVRKPGGKYNFGEYRLGDDTYRVKIVYSGWMIPKEIVENADSPIKQQIRAVQRCKMQVEKKRELDVGAMLATPANWATANNNSTAVNIRTGDFIEEASKVKENVWKNNGGYAANFMAIGWDYLWPFRLNDAVRPLIDGSSSPSNPALALVETIKAILELDEVTVTRDLSWQGTQRSDENPPAGTPAVTTAMGSAVTLGYRPAAPGAEVPSCAYVFQWGDGKVMTWFDQDTNSDKFVYEERYVEKVTMNTAAGVMSAVTK